MHDAFIQALIHIHRTLPRKGPGADQATNDIFDFCAPFLGKNPLMADMGCGNGYGSFKLIDRFGGTVRAIDFAKPFLQELEAQRENHPCSGQIQPIQGDMLDPVLIAGSYDLIWSEGAIAIVGVANALKAWHPFVKSAGLLVYSEACWRVKHPEPEAVAYYNTHYTDLTDRQGHINRAEDIGYKVLHTLDLPSMAWWGNYYAPLKERVEELATTVEPGSALAMVVASFEEQTRMFERFCHQYGYTFFVLQKT